MKYYLSSYRIGKYGAKLAELSAGGPLAYIPNALDHIPVRELTATRERNVTDLQELGVSVELFDLQDYFFHPSRLSRELARFTGVWIAGGNTFVLRQAMKLSGFDEAIARLRSTPFLYSGYSAGICVLAPHLYALQIVDDPNQFPYPEQIEVIWEGLNILNYIILPHYKSDHPESADIDKEVAYCRANNIAYRTLRDGDVLFGENIAVLNRETEID
jgi:dipeptidase E